MVVARPLAISLFLVLLSLAFGATPAAACHRGGDLCLPCQDTDGDCDISREIDGVTIVAELSEYLFPQPMDESMHYDGLDSDERRGYLAVQFEWATDDHTAPAGHANVPFTLEFDPEDGVAWDASTSSSFTFTVNQTRETLYFAFTAPEGEVDIDWRIVANPGPNQQEESGTMTLETYDPPRPDWLEALGYYWPMWLLILIIGLAVGALLGMRRNP